MCLVYTSNKREGEPGFAFPEGCPKGRKRAQRVGPRDIPRGRQTQALPTSCWRYFILFHLVLSLDQGRYEIYTVIPSLVTREGMTVYISYLPWYETLVLVLQMDGGLVMQKDMLAA